MSTLISFAAGFVITYAVGRGLRDGFGLPATESGVMAVLLGVGMLFFLVSQGVIR